MSLPRQGVRVMARVAMQRFGYDPLEQLVLHAQDVNTGREEKLHIAETLLPYMYPKLSNVTVEGELTSNTTAESQANLLRHILENPELADAAQRLSVAAAEAALETEAGLGGAMIQ
jgi:hypothetical protein